MNSNESSIPAYIPTSESAFCEFMESHKAQANAAAENLSQLFGFLKSQIPQLAEVVVSYDGCGDSGQIEDISYYNSKRELIQGIDHLVEAPLPDDVCNKQQRTPGKWVVGEGWVTEGEPVNLSARELIDDLAWDLAYGQHPGFEINEGGYGTVTIMASEDDSNRVRVLLNHSERIIETNDFEYEF